MLPTNLTEAIESGFIPYILEANSCTDLCSTRTTKINAIIKDFKYIISIVDNPNDYKEQIFAKYGLTEDMLTDAECQRIMNAIRRG